jgi:hypothetical protein
MITPVEDAACGELDKTRGKGPIRYLQGFREKTPRPFKYLSLDDIVFQSVIGPYRKG